MDEETLNSPELTAKLIGNKPNTYTFTKVMDLIPTVLLGVIDLIPTLEMSTF